MLHSQFGKSLPVGEEHRTGGDTERSGATPDYGGERRLDLSRATHGDALNRDTGLLGLGFGPVQGETECRARLVPEDRDAGHPWHYDSYEFESLGSQLTVD